MGKSDSSKWSVGARSETGYVRSENQDRMSRVRAHFGDIYIVSDGMGGHKAGALAAELTVQVLEQHLSAVPTKALLSNSVKQAFDAANASVYERGHSGDPQTEGMGATAVVLLTAGSSALVAHLGDSRAYLNRKGHLQSLTKDHTRVQRMVDAGMLSATEANRHPDAGVLEQAIGQKLTAEVEIRPWLRLKDGDEILLCSDGLCGYAEDLEIEGALRGRGGPQELADQLVNLALAKGGKDNVTVQVVRYGQRNPDRDWRPLYQAALLPIVVALSLVAAYLAYDYLQVGSRDQSTSNTPASPSPSGPPSAGAPAEPTPSTKEVNPPPSEQHQTQQAAEKPGSPTKEGGQAAPGTAEQTSDVGRKNEVKQSGDGGSKQ